MSKAAMILSLLKQGLSDKEIATKLNTSIEYIRKVRSVNKRTITPADNLPVRAKTDIAPIQKTDVQVLLGITGSPIIGFIDKESIAIDPVGPESIKTIYSELGQGKSPVEIIANSGLHPVAVEAEYARFLALTLQDHLQLRNKIIGEIVVETNEETEPLIKKYKDTKILTNDEVIQLLKLKIAEIRKKEGEEIRRLTIRQLISSMYSDKERSLPPEFKNVMCSRCHRLIFGIVAAVPGKDDEDYFERKSIMHSYLCTE